MSRTLVIILGAIAATVVIGAVSFGLRSVSSPANEATAPSGSSTAVAESGNVQASDGGGVQVQVTFDPQSVGQSQTISFLVTMNTHSVELSAYDLTKLSRVILDQGATLGEVAWQPKGEGSGHHLEGTLTVQDPTGLARTARKVALEIKGLPGPEVRLFEWKGPAR